MTWTGRVNGSDGWEEGAAGSETDKRGSWTRPMERLSTWAVRDTSCPGDQSSTMSSPISHAPS